jgi:hypothetical protein
MALFPSFFLFRMGDSQFLYNSLSAPNISVASSSIGTGRIANSFRIE